MTVDGCAVQIWNIEGRAVVCLRVRDLRPGDLFAVWSIQSAPRFDSIAAVAAVNGRVRVTMADGLSFSRDAGDIVNIAA
jgi:hypothetical protein